MQIPISKISFGAGPFGGMYQTVNEEEAIKSVQRAFELGINFFDTAPYYGLTKSESLLGIALETAMKTLNISRSDFYISTKVGRYGLEKKFFDYSTEKIRTSVQDSMKRLRTEYIDLIICHDIEFVSLDQVQNEAIPVLLEYKSQGIIKHIGISGYPLDVLLEMTKRCNNNKNEKVIDVVLSYCHLTLQNTLLEDYAKQFQEYGVTLINASPLSMGKLFRVGGPPEWHPGSKELKEKAIEAQKFCEKHGVDISKLALQYSLQKGKGIVASTLLGMHKVSEVEKAIQWSKEPINEEVLKGVLEILKPVQNQTWQSPPDE